MQGFRLGRSAKEHFLKLLRSVMNDIEHNFVDTIFAERDLVVEGCDIGACQHGLCCKVHFGPSS